MKKALIVFLSFLLILNFSACGGKSETSATENIAKVNPEVPEYVYGKYKSHVDFNSFENYASMVGVMGADVLLGKFESGDYSSNETAELSLETKKAVPEYTYYPCFDSKKVPQSRMTITHLMSDGRLTKQKIGLCIKSFGTQIQRPLAWEATYAVSFDKNKDSDFNSVWVSLYQVSEEYNYLSDPVSWDTFADMAVGAAESDEQDGVSKYLYLPEAELADGKHPCVIIIQPRLKRLFIYILIEKNIYIKLNITSSDEEHWNDRLNWLDTSLNDWFKRLSFDRIYFNYGDYKRVVDRNMRIDYLRGKYDFSYDVVC